MPRLPNAAFIGFLLLLLPSCNDRPLHTVRGSVLNVMVGTKDRSWTIREGIALQDTVYVLDFSARTRFHDNMKSLPYPVKDGFYQIPDGADKGNAVQMDNGEVIYFQKSLEYEAVGAIRDLAAIGLAPLRGDTKEYRLLSVKTMTVLGARN